MRVPLLRFGGPRLGQVAAMLLLIHQPLTAMAGGLGIPSDRAGIGFGNLPRFDGIRLNARDSGVEHVRGINLTLLPARRNSGSRYEGLMIGFAPSGGTARGFHLGLAGAGAEEDLGGIAVGGLGCGAGRDLRGLAIGGLGCGAGGSVRGVVIGGLGGGAGDDVRGLVLGGLGGGAGNDFSGIGVGGLGCGAGRDFRGIGIGGLGCGAGRDFQGIGVGGLGCGAGGNLDGIAIGILGAGAGQRARGLLFGGLRVESLEAHGVLISVVNARTRPDGALTGLAASAFNQVLGRQSGLSVGIFNYARSLDGVQIGVLNWVDENAGWRKVLPLLNW